MNETSAYLVGYPLAPAALAAPMPVDTPALSVLDSAAERGDGVFETFGVIRGRAQAIGPHLARLAHSARALDLPDPDLGALTVIVETLAARAEAGREYALKIVLSRGLLGRLNGWAVLGPAPDYTALRTQGMKVITLPVGYPSDFAGSAPWLLFGAKTLSYATNMAATRAAQRADATDAIFITIDGVLLEGPTSSLVIRRGQKLLSPDPALGILHGTTQRAMFDFASPRMSTAYGHIGREDVAAADGAWLVSSVRMAVPLTAIDGTAIPLDDEFTAQLNRHLLARES